MFPSCRNQSGGPPPTTRKIGLSPHAPPPTVLTQKCRFCHFHAVFGHFVQIVPPLVDPNWKTLTGPGHIDMNDLCLKAMLKVLKSVIIIESHVIVTGPNYFSTLLYFTLKCSSHTKLLGVNLFHVTVRLI